MLKQSAQSVRTPGNKNYLQQISNYTYQKINEFCIYALYGGHLDLFLKYLKNQNKDVNEYHALIIICTLRCNHISSYQKYSSLMYTNSTYMVIKKCITLEH